MGSEVLLLSGEGRIVFFLSGSRRRISLSCERLRALLPQFDGRREDMASVLEMSVYFLQLAHGMDPSWDQFSVSCKQAGLVRPLQHVYYGIASLRGVMSFLLPSQSSAQGGRMFCTLMIHSDHTSWYSQLPVCGSFSAGQEHSHADLPRLSPRLLPYSPMYTCGAWVDTA